jgi:hypothetical protein
VGVSGERAPFLSGEWARWERALTEVKAAISRPAKDARQRAEHEHSWTRRADAAARVLSGSPGWYGWRVWAVVASDAATLPEVLREWSLLDVWRHSYHVALARAMEG